MEGRNLFIHEKTRIAALPEISSPDWERNIIQFHLAKCNRIQICSTRIQLSPKRLRNFMAMRRYYDHNTDHNSFSLCQHLIFRKSAIPKILQFLIRNCENWWFSKKKNVKFPTGLKFNPRVKSVEPTGCGMTTCINLHWSKWHFAFELREILFTTPQISMKFGIDFIFERLFLKPVVQITWKLYHFIWKRCCFHWNILFWSIFW